MKGQTAMEYLMTYGWAIVVIVIVLGVLAFMFSGAQTFEYCSFNPVGSYTCVGNPAVTAPSGGGNVQMKITFRNGYSTPVTLTEYACVASESGQYSGAYTSASATVQPGDTYVATVSCNDVNGNPYSSTPGAKFSGRFIVHYRLSTDDATVTREATATVRGTVAQG